MGGIQPWKRTLRLARTHSGRNNVFERVEESSSRDSKFRVRGWGWGSWRRHTLRNGLVPSPWGICQGSSVCLHVGFVGWFLNSLDLFLLHRVWCLLSWLSLVLLSNCDFHPWPGCLFCSTPHRSCKWRSINTLFTVKLLGLII